MAVLSSDGSLLLLRETDRRLGLTRMLASFVQDRRDPSRINHAVKEMQQFRIMAIAFGHEDADDCDALRNDPLFKLAAGDWLLQVPDRRGGVSHAIPEYQPQRLPASNLLSSFEGRGPRVASVMSNGQPTDDPTSGE
ncbi:transposase [Aestuariivirga sp.]|jgi:hypothetical protein|uniref:transposase n=1 Tax=Aestuariivirga sp. TaxID=2650926 RepID=UPI003783F9CB